MKPYAPLALASPLAPAAGTPPLPPRPSRGLVLRPKVSFVRNFLVREFFRPLMPSSSAMLNTFCRVRGFEARRSQRWACVSTLSGPSGGFLCSCKLIWSIRSGTNCDQNACSRASFICVSFQAMGVNAMFRRASLIYNIHLRIGSTPSVFGS